MTTQHSKVNTLQVHSTLPQKKPTMQMALKSIFQPKHFRTYLSHFQWVAQPTNAQTRPDHLQQQQKVVRVSIGL